MAKMISVGIDAVDIERFAHWASYRANLLERVYTPAEIAYCRAIEAKSAERFAARFAVKEACYKAVTPLLKKPVTFLAFCKCMQITQNSHPKIALDESRLHIDRPNFQISLSLTHTARTAIAVVIFLD